MGPFRVRLPFRATPYVLNVVSKILAFITALTLFLPQRVDASAPRPHIAWASRLHEPADAPHNAGN